MSERRSRLKSSEKSNSRSRSLNEKLVFDRIATVCPTKQSYNDYKECVHGNKELLANFKALVQLTNDTFSKVLSKAASRGIEEQLSVESDRFRVE